MPPPTALGPIPGSWGSPSPHGCGACLQAGHTAGPGWPRLQALTGCDRDTLLSSEPGLAPPAPEPSPLGVCRPPPLPPSFPCGPCHNEPLPGRPAVTLPPGRLEPEPFLPPHPPLLPTLPTPTAAGRRAAHPVTGSPASTAGAAASHGTPTHPVVGGKPELGPERAATPVSSHSQRGRLRLNPGSLPHFPASQPPSPTPPWPLQGQQTGVPDGAPPSPHLSSYGFRPV